MTRMKGPNFAVMCNFINIHTYINTYIHTYIHAYIKGDQCEWHRITRMTGPDCTVMCNLINIHTYIHTYIHEEAGGGAQGTQGSSNNCTSRESVSPLSHLIRGFRNKYH